MRFSRPVIFGVLIIIAVYLPVLTLQSLEGRMFPPHGRHRRIGIGRFPSTCTFRCAYVVYSRSPSQSKKFSRRPTRKKASPRSNWFDRLRDAYGRSLGRSERHRKLILFASIVLIVGALGSLKFIGTEFMPTLDEGSMVVTSKRLPGIALSESVAIGNEIERTIKAHDGVTSVVTKLGRPDLATEAMGEYESDSYLSFTPQAAECQCQSQAGVHR